jgi:hypothetical protein
MVGDTTQPQKLFIYSAPEMYLILEHFCQRFGSGEFSTNQQNRDLEDNPDIYRPTVNLGTMLIINSIVAPGTPKAARLTHPHKGFILFSKDGFVASAYVDYDMTILRRQERMPSYLIGIQDQEGEIVHLSFRPTERSQDLASVLSKKEYPWTEEILQQNGRVTGIVPFISDLFTETGVRISKHIHNSRWGIFFSCYDPESGKSTTIEPSDFFEKFQFPESMRSEALTFAIQQRQFGD